MNNKMGLDDYLVAKGKKGKECFLSLPRVPAIVYPPLASIEDMSVAELIDKPSIPVDMLIKNFIATGIVAGLVAQGGTGKSFFSLQLATAIATGTGVCNIESFEAQMGKVVYISAEDDLQIIQPRLKEIIKQLNYSKKDIEKIIENLYVRSVIGEETLLTKKENTSDCVRTDYLKKVISTVKQFKNCKAIIIDPVNSFRGGDENSSSDNQRFLEACRSIAKKTGATIILIHHANKESSRNGNNDQNAARGSSAFTDGLRAQINMSKMNSNDKSKFGLSDEEMLSYVKFSLTKTNYTKPSGDIWLKRTEEGALIYAKLVKKEDAEKAELLDEVEEHIKSEQSDGNEYSIRAFCDNFSGKDNILVVEKIL